MADSASSSRKQRKRYFPGGGGGGSSKKGRRNRLEPGVKGFLATSSNKDERSCLREVHALLNEYADRLYDKKEPDSKQPDNKADSESEDEEDVEAALEKERNALVGQETTSVEKKDGSKSTQLKPSNRRFVTLDTNVANNVFVATESAELEPCILVHSILTDIKETGRRQSRFTQRLLPVEITCKAYADDIERALTANKDLLSKHFTVDKDSEPPTYAIFYKHRNNDHLKRDDVYRVVNELISATNPLAKIDLDKPKKSVLIEVLQTVACISIVEDYVEFSKYNLHLVGKKE